MVPENNEAKINNYDFLVGLEGGFHLMNSGKSNSLRYDIIELTIS